MTQRGKMSVEMRAKQFMPFSALPGLDEALARAEQEAEREAKAPVRSHILNLYIYFSLNLKFQFLKEYYFQNLL